MKSLIKVLALLHGSPAVMAKQRVLFERAVELWSLKTLGLGGYLSPSISYGHRWGKHNFSLNQSIESSLSHFVCQVDSTLIGLSYRLQIRYLDFI